jgi:hypothetical protein
MKNKLTIQQKHQKLANRCKDISVTTRFIENCQLATKNAIEQILNMGTAVKEVYELSKSGELNIYDLNYFCMNVGISQKSSTFRKYKAIGENANKFRQYMDRLPSAFSTLYEIATLDADTFEKIFINGNNCQGLTLKQIKHLANKNNPVPTKNNSKTNNPSYVSPASIRNLLDVTNRFSIYIPSSLSESQMNEVINIFEDLKSKGMISCETPTILSFRNDEDDHSILKLAA